MIVMPIGIDVFGTVIKGLVQELAELKTKRIYQIEDFASRWIKE